VTAYSPRSVSSSPLEAVDGHEVYDVFTPTHPARLNFVERGEVNDQLVDALRTPGKQLIVYGESGSGKSSLLLKKLEETYPDHVTTRCHASMTFDQLLLSAFDKLDRYYVESRVRSTGREIKGGLSAEFARIRASVEAAASSSLTESMARVTPPQLTVQRLGEFMGEQELCWLIEDFHKMPTAQKVPLAQSLKVFSDLGTDYPHVKIIAVGATETAREVVEYDSDIRNRVSELLVPLMTDTEIARIVSSGATLLNVDMSALSTVIVQYSVGMPSVCHQLALNACLEKGIERTMAEEFIFEDVDFVPAAQRYVREASDTLKSTFDKALTSQKVRRYDNRRLILMSLARGKQSGMPYSDILDDIRRQYPQYPASNLTKYLTELQGSFRGSIIRKASDGRFRFTDPIFHTYAQVIFDIRPVERWTVLTDKNVMEVMFETVKSFTISLRSSEGIDIEPVESWTPSGTSGTTADGSHERAQTDTDSGTDPPNISGN